MGVEIDPQGTKTGKDSALLFFIFFFHNGLLQKSVGTFFKSAQEMALYYLTLY